MKSGSISKINHKKIINLILTGATTITLAFWTTFQDPFGPLKLFLLSGLAAWLIGYLSVVNRKLLELKLIKGFIVILMSFLFSLSVATFATENKIAAIMGDSQRNLGWLFYFALSILIFVTVIFMRIENIVYLVRFVIILCSILTTYGLLQLNGIDFVDWLNSYNAMIVTVGNPNFAAALLAILNTVIVGTLLTDLISIKVKLYCIILIFFGVIVIFLSEAWQGLISLTLGISIILLIWLQAKNKVVFYLASLTFVSIGISAVLGMLRIGPLSDVLYKQSVSVRGYYWRAGIEMFQSNPILGVGIDRYGSYFKEFRELNYPLTYGYEITSTNAHNTFIQIFATSGIFTGAAYVVLILFIALVGVQGIRNSIKQERIILTTLMAAWIAYQASSFVSIENAGTSVWGWILGGTVVALSIEKLEKNSKSSLGPIMPQSKFAVKQPLISLILVSTVVLVFIPVFRGESSTFIMKAVYNPGLTENVEYVKLESPKVLNNPMTNVSNKLLISTFLVNSGQISEGMNSLELILKDDFRNQDAANLLAVYYFQLNEIQRVISLRERIQKLDPYNFSNLLELGRCYKLTNSLDKMAKIKERIINLAPNTKEAEIASEELVS
jgi:O-antigen ligase